jgi:hypothetical protein
MVTTWKVNCGGAEDGDETEEERTSSLDYDDGQMMARGNYVVA